MNIVPLNLEHEAALREFLDEFAASGETEINGYFGRPEWTHAETVVAFARWSDGEPPEGWVPSTTSFLVEEGRILGVSSLRHRLTPHLFEHGGHVGYSVRPSERNCGHATRLLRDAARKARRLGIERLLVACDADNVSSACVIEKCGGVLENEVPTDDAPICRYWIRLRERGRSF
ncbi:MAG: GNAT family N-acetyltransferase [Candidatus Bipolaricaulota bacterium]|nr:GNAT family N-acetyltransferase [Candidatus Bipolaricaulota bacterium]